MFFQFKAPWAWRSFRWSMTVMMLMKLINYNNLWEGKVHLIPGVGHAPFWEVPGVFDVYLSRFLKSLQQDR